MKRSFATALAWGALAASALSLAGLAVYSIYRENLQAEKQRAALIAQQQQRLEERLSTYFSEIQNETARALVGFHEEALVSQLERWANSDPLIASASVISDRNLIEEMLARPEVELIDLDDPETPSYLRSGYYRDNKEIALYENGSTQPILFWLRDDRNANPQWLLGHRLSVERSARIARIDTNELARALNALLEELSGPNLAAKLEPIGKRISKFAASSPPSSVLPSYQLQIVLQVDESEQWLGLFGYAMVAVSLTLGALCSVLIFRQVNRERREATRKTTFVSQISHEFKTPLTSISLYAELMANEQLDAPKRERYLSTISRESHRLSEMVDNILALNALELGKKQYRIQNFDLAEAIDSVVSDYRPSLADSSMELLWTPPLHPTEARFDLAALRQILLNLFDNARKYAASGGFISLTLDRTENTYRLCVEDRGPGIADSAKRQIFEAFFQEKQKLTDKSPGAGIGLSISKHLAKDCHGDLSLDTEYKKGACFVLSIPIAPQSLSNTPPHE